MSAEIIPFPSQNYDDLPTEVIEIDYITLSNGQKVTKPTCRHDYLVLCKDLLPEDTYKQLLLAILDDEYFQASDRPVKTMVQCYLEVFDS